MAYTQYFHGRFEQKLPTASVPDITPPTFAGIASVTPNNSGSITATWAAATDASPPVSYLVYIALGSVSAASLFVASNLSMIVSEGDLNANIFMLGDQSTYILNGQLYTLGVRAKDAYGNLNTNTAILTTTAIASSNLPAVIQLSATRYTAQATFSLDSTNNLLGTFWATVNDVTLNSLLGAASYTIYGAGGTPVPTLTETGIMPDVNGMYHITPVLANMLLSNTHYVAAVSIIIDGTPRANYFSVTDILLQNTTNRIFRSTEIIKQIKMSD